jgi:acetyltransferase EpsM
MEDKIVRPVLIPLLNQNEPEALLAELYVAEGQYVRQGDPIVSLETTKSTTELVAEAGGYIRGLRHSKGQSARAGELLCYLAADPQWAPPESVEEKTTIAEEMRITQPALELARRLGLSLANLPTDVLITEAMVRSLVSPAAIAASDSEFLPTPGADFDPTEIVIYGGGGHGKMVVDLLRARGAYRIAGFIDDGLQPGTTIMGLPVLGNGQILAELHAQGVRLAVNAVGGIGDIRVRIKIFERLVEAGFACPAVTHPSAYLDPTANLEAGAQVMAMAYVGSEARLGFGSIVNTGAIVSHDCQLGSFTIISPGAMLAGEVQVGSQALIGMGATVNLGVKIGRGARLGNGATVKTDVPEAGVVHAGTVWPA